MDSSNAMQLTSHMQQEQVMREIVWNQAAQRRLNFIENLLSEMEEMVFQKKSKKSGKTTRSAYYSSKVAEYDRDNMNVFAV